MTQEEKARAYDEALNKAKIEINTKGIGETVDLCKQLFPKLAESEKIREEINTLYSEIDLCIWDLIKARTDKDAKAESKALFKMEGLMVATLQDLSCIEDYLDNLI